MPATSGVVHIFLAKGPCVSVEVALADKVAFVAAPESHAVERPAVVTARETHLSWVFLTDRFAYKLKKPVRTADVDLRMLEARRRNCLTEVRLNRRLAPEVYRGVVPLTLEPGGDLGLGRSGDPVEWLVAMRRLPEERMLDEALRAGGPDREDLDCVARKLASFYGSRPAEPVAPDTRRAWFDQEIALSWRALTRPAFVLEHARIERLIERLRHFLRSRADLLADRHRTGNIVEGHGDLRPEHICLEREPVIIDCLEFSRTLRILDPADEIGFLALECRMLGHPGAGERLQRDYEEMSGDRPPEELLAFYASFRALVRARLSALHSLQPEPRSPADWLARAGRYIDQALGYSDLMR